MILYHGTRKSSAINIINNGIDLHRGKKRADFGKGFYLTPDLRTAKDWAIHKSYHESPCIVSIDFDELTAIRNGWIKIFNDRNLEWAQFIVNNRCGEAYINLMAYKENNLSGQFPVVKGFIADGNMFEMIQEFEKTNVQSQIKN